jgi:hypothetical protein
VTEKTLPVPVATQLFLNYGMLSTAQTHDSENIDINYSLHLQCHVMTLSHTSGLLLAF